MTLSFYMLRMYCFVSFLFCGVNLAGIKSVRRISFNILPYCLLLYGIRPFDIILKCKFDSKWLVLCGQTSGLSLTSPNMDRLLKYGFFPTNLLSLINFNSLFTYQFLHLIICTINQLHRVFGNKPKIE